MYVGPMNSGGVVITELPYGITDVGCECLSKTQPNIPDRCGGRSGMGYEYGCPKTSMVRVVFQS